MVDNTYRNELALAMPQELIDQIVELLNEEHLIELIGYDLTELSLSDRLRCGLELQAKIRYMWADAMIKIGNE